MASSSWGVFIEGLEDLGNIPELDNKIRRMKAAQAINATATHGRT